MTCVRFWRSRGYLAHGLNPWPFVRISYKPRQEVHQFGTPSNGNEELTGVEPLELCFEMMK